MAEKELKLGAEARLTLKDGVVVKERIRKSYRLEQIDSALRKDRTSREASLLQKAARSQLKQRQSSSTLASAACVLLPADEFAMRNRCKASQAIRDFRIGWIAKAECRLQIEDFELVRWPSC